ncbi:ATP-binding cassette domain-containing protein [uncultured Pelagimonas sp.]|uniref:thiamine ABC transporter ATP-binding protein n=1 Tax=uncultured Pelagimonas sp. TaxID=1618102 RepID=UPI00260181DC|nr:ATP-binding cassette domain-containing protein [uncultured Pelagimonas sp.]
MDNSALTGTLSLAPGRRVAILGPSGAGKSTLLDVVAGFRPLRAGQVGWCGADLTHSPPNKRPVSILFQDGNLFPHLTVFRNLLLALKPNGQRASEEDSVRIEGALKRVGLAGMSGRKPGTLSGGQQSRAALARVMLQARPIILLDEPFSALGPALKAEMLGLVRDVAGNLGALVVMVTHDPDDARRFAEDVVLVADDKVHLPVATAAFFANPPEAYQEYVGTQ